MRSLSVFSAMANGARQKASGPLQSVPTRGGWWPVVREAFTGAWQQNIEWSVDTALAYHAVYACITLIAADIGKLRPKLMEQDANGIWNETDSPAYSPVLRKPNRFQNHIQFKEQWITSKLMRGNAYALKERDDRGVVRREYLLDPTRVQPLVSPDGSVFYQLGGDYLARVTDGGVTVPASEIIHDRMNCIFHPLVGTSPLFACGLAASQGLKIQEDSTRFFANGARPGGVLTAPGAISDETAKRLKDHWDENYGGAKAGKVAVLGDNLKFEPMRMSAVEAELIAQLKWTAEVVCSCFHVPPFKIGHGDLPTGQKVGDMNQIYYTDCLQSLIESMELCQDEGLGLDVRIDGRGPMGTELELDGLLRMDPSSQTDILVKRVGGSIDTPNEARKALNRGPLTGGDTVYMQQQNYSLAALAERDKGNPLAAPATAPAPAPAVAPAPAPPDDAAAQEARDFLDYIQKELTHAA
ncbi:phage portal protein [Variovorax paradoxus]|uniref:Phage portal protein n=1 Tax=Variovorax paradoxus TaxID=34073 RepID=A0A679JIC8_VARPD|nr:hypothetical protein VVAX_03542 [Variovorax paradoxus]